MILWSSNRLSPSRTDMLLRRSLGLLTCLAASVVVFVIGFVLVESLPAFSEIELSRIISDDTWHPADPDNATFGLIPMLVGSFLVTFCALLWAAPLGISIAIANEFYPSRFMSPIVRRTTEIMAGIPSIVFGFWGLTTLVPLIANIQAPGQSLLAGSIVLGMMILPTIVLTTEQALHSLPNELAIAAAATGVGRFAFLWHVALPTCRGGILSGVVLGLARAIGETMAVLMVSGNIVQIPGSLFDPFRTITTNIALEMGYATQTHRTLLFLTAAILIAMVVPLMAVMQSLNTEQSHG